MLIARVRSLLASRSTARRWLARLGSVALAGSTVAALGAATLSPGPASAAGSLFRYGYDLDQQAPFGTGSVASASIAARNVMASLPGTMDDVSIMGWGDPNPEPSPGHFDLSGIRKRLALVTAAGGTPVISLAGAPDWMKGGRPGTTNWNWINNAPTPAHYQDFATLAATVARSFPNVRYFVVWNELKGFFDRSHNDWNAAGYTAMYNDVYAAIKAVRPDAQVGGPYASMTAGTASIRQSSAVEGPFGAVDPRVLHALSYWITHKAGADFIAVDGATQLAKTGDPALTPLAAVGLYAAADRWIRSQTSLPIWWMESHIQPLHSGWTAQQAASVRVATLVEMATSGASVGMQWQPQQEAYWPDLGLWTSTLHAGGGQPTALAADLADVLSVLAGGVSLLAGEPPGVLVAKGPAGTVLVNTTATTARASFGSRATVLAGGQTLVIR